MIYRTVLYLAILGHLLVKRVKSLVREDQPARIPVLRSIVMKESASLANIV